MGNVLKCVFISNQDQLSADMYSFVAKEIDYASYFQTVSATSVPAGYKQPMSSADPLVSHRLSVQLIEVQAEYHRKSLELLQSILPQIKAHQGEFEFTVCDSASLAPLLVSLAVCITVTYKMFFFFPPLNSFSQSN